ncbi:Uncharacterized protein dnm_072380 [Desulfonema magnum]|uniref:Uncharacterized protein n=1 Tax=Desulfonema magnum TaxID=45655 RepID=A0A975BTJ2_9BACT|nr:Uncharacterized protein dnm_072380 [Desulfonema magnum]
MRDEEAQSSYVFTLCELRKMTRDYTEKQFYVSKEKFLED